jgi:hypothetical protein
MAAARGTSTLRGRLTFVAITWAVSTSGTIDATDVELEVPANASREQNAHIASPPRGFSMNQVQNGNVGFSWRTDFALSRARFGLRAPNLFERSTISRAGS